MVHCSVGISIPEQYRDRVALYLATQRRRMKTVRLNSLVKPKYRGLDDVREKQGEAVAVEEFFRRRRRGR